MKTFNVFGFILSLILLGAVILQERTLESLAKDNSGVYQSITVLARQNDELKLNMESVVNRVYQDVCIKNGGKFVSAEEQYNEVIDTNEINNGSVIYGSNFDPSDWNDHCVLNGNNYVQSDNFSWEFDDSNREIIK